MRHISKNRQGTKLKLCVRNGFIPMTHAKFHFKLIDGKIFGMQVCEPSPRPDKQFKRPGMIGLKLERPH